jgi:hypothetical protein
VGFEDGGPVHLADPNDRVDRAAGTTQVLEKLRVGSIPRGERMREARVL